MTSLGSIVLLFVIATAVSIIARRLDVPYTVALVAAGLGLGAIHAIQSPPLTRELMFVLVLPALLFDAAFDLNIEELRRDGVTLSALAVPGVIAAIVLIAVALGPATRLLGASAAATPLWPAALIFAALISATDPVAVVALFRALDAPRRLQVIVEGESLLNDGTAIIFFTMALGSVAGARLSVATLANFVYVVGAGVIVGGVLGAIAALGIRRLQEPTLEVMLTTIAAYGSFAAADSVGASGVIATVTAGVLCGTSVARSGLSVGARVVASTFWNYLAFALNSLVFLTIGLTVRIPTLLEQWRPILAAYVLVTLTRAVVTIGAVAALPHGLRLSRQWTAILAWGGLRGALSMVLALSIPDSFPQHDLIVTVTFGVVILSILVQGITVKPALAWLGLSKASSHRVSYAGLQTALLGAHSSLEDVQRTGNLIARDDAMWRTFTPEFDSRLGQAEHDLTTVGEYLGVAQLAASGARRILVRTERERILDAFRSGVIDAEQRDRRLSVLRTRWWDESDTGAQS